MLKRDRIVRSVAAVIAAMVVTMALIAPASAQTAASADTATAKAAAKPAKAPKAPRAAKATKPKLSLAEDRKLNGSWTRGTNWLSLRAGYAKLTTETAGSGFVGYGLAYQHNITSKYGFVATVHHEILGAQYAAKEISVPMTVGFVRHMNWRTAARPYLGMGAGYYFHKYYRTGEEYGGSPSSGWYLNGGFNVPLDQRRLLGIDTRVSFVDGREGVLNPVFGRENEAETQWSLKLNWSMAY